MQLRYAVGTAPAAMLRAPPRANNAGRARGQCRVASRRSGATGRGVLLLDLEEEGLSAGPDRAVSVLLADPEAAGPPPTHPRRRSRRRKEQE